MCSKLTIKTAGRCHWCRSGVFINSYFTPRSSVSIVNFEHVIFSFNLHYLLPKERVYLTLGDLAATLTLKTVVLFLQDS